jgi:beta-glucosidase
MRTFILYIVFIVLSFKSTAQLTDFEYLNTDLSVEDRVDILVSQMTVEEKVDQMVYEAPAIPRLGVPEYNWWNECLHGVARAGYATVFPQSITIAGSWDKDLVYRVATTISNEARAIHHEFVRRGKRGIYQGLTFWSPNINIFRDPRWGRGHETYGEDPYLSGQLGLHFVKGLQGDNPDYLKVIATAKHFAVHSGPESLRHQFNAQISERDLRETYLPAFRTLVVDGDVYSVMGAYNQFRDYPCCANPVLQSILREEWGFDGYMVSDCGAISDFYKYQGYSADAAEAAAIAVKNGTDLNCGDSYFQLREAVKRDLISEDQIDVSVRRLFKARFKLGMFDSDEEVPYAQIPFEENTSEKNSRLALEAARKSIVLLKNDNNILPLSRDIKILAIIGPNADNVEALLGNYNGIPKDPVTVLKGLKNKLKKTDVLFAEGSHLAEGVHNLHPVPVDFLETEDGEPGVIGEYFDNAELKGEPVFKRIDKNIDFYWESGAPSPVLPNDSFSVRWTGYLVPPASGTYYLGCWGMPTLDIWLEGIRILGHNSRHHAFHHEKVVELEARKRYKFVYEYKNWYGDGDVRFLWVRPNSDMLGDALKIVKKADVVVLVLGLSQRLEGEEMPIKVDGFSGGDRTHLKLPETQRKLMMTLKKETDKPVILVLLNGSALAINWADQNIDAIVSAGYPGQEGGHAVADVLFGDYNPAGRLPVTYYKSIDQLPPFDDYDMKGRTYRYFKNEPLYPFGYGLSYTNFKYDDLELPEEVRAGKPVKVKVRVTNNGKLAGDEVVQLYITDEKASTPRPFVQLEGFERIHLYPRESKEVEFELAPRQFSMIGEDDKRIIENGWFTISIGGGQPGTEGTSFVSGRINLSGHDVSLE